MTLHRLALAALLAFAFAVTGCGGGEEDGAEPAATTAGAAATTADDGGGYGDKGQATRGSGDGGALQGSVGPGFDISLSGTDDLTAGDYTLVVDDRSSIHNFHLTGPGGVDVATSVDGEGEETFEVTLEPGEYTFVCDPHQTQMRGSFTVG